MNSFLIKKLIEKGAVRQNTEFEAYYNVHGLSCLKNAQVVGKFRVQSASIVKDTVIFEALSENNKTYRFPSDKVLSIDGMIPEKLAEAYDIRIEQPVEIIVKRRGRKPRLQSEITR